MRYGYYFCTKRCGQGSSIPIKHVDAATTELLANISLTDASIELISAFLRRTYYLRIGALKQKRDHADIELKKVYETRQTLIEKNLNGIYSDDVFKEQNKLLEERIIGIQVLLNAAVIDKYNLEAITKFIQGKL